MEFNLLLRIPGWCGSWKVWLNDRQLTATVVPGNYLHITRTWNPGDRVRLELAMPAVLVEGHYSDERLIAVRRGPLGWQWTSGSIRDFGSPASRPSPTPMAWWP